MPRALQTAFFGVKRDEKKRISRLIFIEIGGEREKRGGAGRVIVGAVVNFAVLDADVIVMRRDDDIFFRIFPPLYNADDVRALSGFGVIAGSEREFLQIRSF